VDIFAWGDSVLRRSASRLSCAAQFVSVAFIGPLILSSSFQVGLPSTSSRARELVVDSSMSCPITFIELV
jgi:hypothetical protein